MLITFHIQIFISPYSTPSLISHIKSTHLNKNDISTILIEQRLHLWQEYIPPPVDSCQVVGVTAPQNYVRVFLVQPEWKASPISLCTNIRPWPQKNIQPNILWENENVVVGTFKLLSQNLPSPKEKLFAAHWCIFVLHDGVGDASNEL